jgi:hypothetical protein
MELTGLGGGVMLAIAAGLWLVYLVPNWLKRREYLATEKNAVRLQQTIRVLAETSELPKQLRAPSGPVAVGRAPQLPARPDPQLLAARRVRRTRALATLVLVASVVVSIVAGIGAAWLVVGAAGLTALCSLALLGRLAEVSRARRAPVARAARSSTQFADHAPVAQQREEAPWTPVPVPKPLYLSRTQAPAAAAVDPAFELELAAASAQRALRETEQPPAVVPAARPAATSRFAAMGIVDAADASAPDIDAVLARRRAAG